MALSMFDQMLFPLVCGDTSRICGGPSPITTTIASLPAVLRCAICLSRRRYKPQ